MNGLWHETDADRQRRSSSRFSTTAKVGTALGAGLPLGLVAAKLLVRRLRDTDRKGSGPAPAA
jgi:hypothetical protein